MRPTSILSSEKVQTVHQHARAHGDLLVLGEEILHVAVERHRAQLLERELVFGPDLRVVERVEVEFGMVVIVHRLHEEIPLREVALLDGVEKVLGRAAEVLALHLVGFGLGQALHAAMRGQWYLTSVVPPSALTIL